MSKNAKRQKTSDCKKHDTEIVIVNKLCDVGPSRKRKHSLGTETVLITDGVGIELTKDTKDTVVSKNSTDLKESDTETQTLSDQLTKVSMQLDDLKQTLERLNIETPKKWASGYPPSYIS